MNEVIAAGQDPIWNVLIRFLVALVVLFIVIRLVYYRYTRKDENVLSYFLMGIMIFLVCILLKTVDIKLGVALGLFAIFAISRFRSRNLPLRDMTYFFTVLGISVINAMATFYHPVGGPIIINTIIVLSVVILEFFFHKRTPLSNCQLIYDRLELLSPEKKKDLLSDLSSRTGIKIEKARICKIDLSKGQAELRIFYKNSNKKGESKS